MPTTVKAKWPIRIGDVLVPASEIGRIATLEEAKTVIPGIEYKPGSNQVAVVFRDWKPCIVYKKQLVYANDN